MNYLEKHELPWEVWTTSGNMNFLVKCEQGNNQYICCPNMQKRWNICHMNCLKKCVLLWEVWTREHAMCHISNESSWWGDQDVMIYMPKRIKAYKNRSLMVISHQIHMSNMPNDASIWRNQVYQASIHDIITHIKTPMAYKWYHPHQKIYPSKNIIKHM